MVFDATIFCQLLLAASALALPSRSERLNARSQHRSEGGHHARPRLPIDGLVNARSKSEIYNPNWAGAVLSSSANTWKSVTATFTVPTPVAGSSGVGSSWVGIDGSTCDTAILQAGVDVTVSSGTTSYAAWAEFWPAETQYFSNFTVKGGDVISLTVTATSATAGTVVIDNVTTGKQLSQSLTSSYALCRQDVEWIVEDIEGDSGDFVPFLNFGSVTFSSAGATRVTKSGTVSPSGSQIYDIEQNSKVLTSTSISGSCVTIKHK